MPQNALVLSPNNSRAAVYDRDAISYFSRAGVTNATAKAQINAFVKGVKALGLWSNLVCWPLRSAQNKGSGTTAYSLGGYSINNGTLSSAGLWGTDGLALVNSSTFINTGLTLGAYPDSLFVVTRLNTSPGLNTDYIFTAGINSNGRQFAAALSGLITSDNLYAARDTWLTFANDSGMFPANASTLGAGTRYVSWRPQSNTSLSVTCNNDFASSTLNGWAASSAGQIISSANAAQDFGFYAIIKTQVSNTLDASFRSLYKTTLGTGLGLP